MWATVESVSGGTETIDGCPDCGMDRVHCELHAISAEGVIRLGVMTECAICGSHYQCGYCGRYLPSEAPRIWQHVISKHGVAAGA
jgi:transcription elongation factor Elf1